MMLFTDQHANDVPARRTHDCVIQPETAELQDRFYVAAQRKLFMKDLPVTTGLL